MKKFVEYCNSIKKKVEDATTVDIINWHVTLLSRGLKPKSVMGYLTAVVSMRQRLGLTETDGIVNVARQALRAKGAVPSGPKPVPSLDRLWARLHELEEVDPGNRKAARARALVLLRLATLARSFDMENWRSDSVVIRADGMQVVAERTKHNPAPKTYRIPRVISEDAEKRRLCPVAAFERYRDAYCNIRVCDYVWRAVKAPFQRIKADTIASATKEVLVDAGYTREELLPHGLRSVGATLARQGGATLEAVKQAGGWKSWETMLNYYLHAGDFGTIVAEAIYDAFPGEASSVEES